MTEPPTIRECHHKTPPHREQMGLFVTQVEGLALKPLIHLLSTCYCHAANQQKRQKTGVYPYKCLAHK